MKTKRYLTKTKMMPYIFIAPAVLLIIGFLVYPIGNVFYYSLQNYNVNKPYDQGFIGLGNFITILTKDKLFYPSLLISVKWVLIEVVLQLIAGTIIALILNQSFKLRGLCRALIFSPWAISGVLTTMMWALMYNQNMGVINDLLMKIGIIKEPVAWVANLNTVFGSVVVAELWRGIPFFAIMMLAALQTIPLELYEACHADGGGKWQELKYVIFPFLKESIILSTLLRSVWEFNNVDLIFTLTGGGPANMTTTLNMYMTNTAIRDSDFGYGAALAVIAFVILLVFASAYLSITNFGKEE